VSGMAISKVPNLPLAVNYEPFQLTSTLSGIVIGNFPIRDIFETPYLPNIT